MILIVIGYLARRVYSKLSVTIMMIRRLGGTGGVGVANLLIHIMIAISQ